MPKFGRWILLSCLLWFHAVSLPATPVSSLMCANPGSTVASANAAYVNANSCTDFSYAFPSIQPSTGLNNWLYGYYAGVSAVNPAFNPGSFQTMLAIPAYNSSGQLTGQNAGWWSQNFAQYWTALDAFEGHSNSSYTDLHQAPYCDPVVLQNCGNGFDSRSPNSPGSTDAWATRRYIVPSGYSGMLMISLSTEKDPRTSLPGSMGDTEYIVKVHDGVATTLACVNVPVDGIMNPNVIYPDCGNTQVSTDPYASSPIYSTAVSTNVQPGDFVDLILVPSYNADIQTSSGTTAALADFSSAVFQLEQITGVPEPGTFSLLAAGILCAGLTRCYSSRRS